MPGIGKPQLHDFRYRLPPFATDSYVPIPDDGFPELPTRYPTLNPPFDFCATLAQLASELSIKQRPVGGGQFTLLTLAARMSLTAGERDYLQTC